LTFFDLFAGSGVISRFAKFLGFKVYSNDWEHFSYVINKAYLEVDKNDLYGMFREYGGISNLIETLNNLSKPCEDEQYIAKHYSPSTHDIENLDFKKERMFYTRDNGLIIDKIRNRIEELYPEESVRENREKQREKHLLVALLLYEAATHTNTSGVFKAYHKGFGGHNRDALSRILAPIKIKMPVLISSNVDAEVYKEDANKLVLSNKICDIEFDIVYLDPPYNQHQYGSNYHLLNTISLWDKLPVNNNTDKHGYLSEKAAIRKDWTKTRSDYCYREKASDAFDSLIGNIKSRYILISYSTEGIIPFEQMRRICSKKGKLDLVTDEYIKYRGGKQSIGRLNRNIEFVMIIDTSGKSTGHSFTAMDKVLETRKLALMFNNRYSLKRLRRYFDIDLENQSIKLIGSSTSIKTKGFFELFPVYDIESVSKTERKKLIESLEKSMCVDKEEELSELLEKILSEKDDTVYYLRKIPDTIRKFAHKKYRDKFYFWLEKIKLIEKLKPQLYSFIRDKIGNLEEVADKRFKG
jgi:adenine-specific DNA-methyltransferase